MSTLAGVILAAGKASRFGSDKLLYELTLAGERRPLIQHALLPWLSVFEEISVVIRPDARRLQQALLDFAILHHKTIHLIECKKAALGMGHSLRAAIEATPEAVGWIIGLADMPLIPVSVLKKIYQNLILGGHITAPYFEGRRGHPVGLSYSYKDELLALKGDSGAKRVLQRDVEKIQKFESNHSGILMDIDYEHDVSQIEKELAN